MIDYPLLITYLSAVSQYTIRVYLVIAALNDLYI